MNQLEQFFKRSNFNDLKPFSCSSCGAGYGSAKTLKKHMADKHGIKVTSKKGKKPKTDEQENDEEDNEQDDTPQQETPSNIRTF